MLTTTEGNDREVVVTAYAHTLQKVIRIASPWSRDDYRPKGKIEEVFLNILSFFNISTQVLDFRGLKMINAGLILRGFAPL